MHVVLIKRVVLDRIAADELDVVYRRWKRPTVVAGGSLRTAVGILAVESVERTSLAAITAAEAQRAGYESKAALVRELSRRAEGDVYRIGVRFTGADPRIALRERADMDKNEMIDLQASLDRLDQASRRGPWTGPLLDRLGE